MTIEQLFSVQMDNNKLRSLYIELARHEDFNPFRNNSISDMPKGSSGKNFLEEYTEKKEELERQIDFYKKKIQEDRRILDEYINEAPYPECDIIRFRAINNLSWEEIGDYIGYTRRWVSHRFCEYIKSTENTENTA